MKSVMKTAQLLLATTALATASFAASAELQTYEFDKTHTRVAFGWNHLGFSNMEALITDFDGTLKFDADAPATSSVAVTFRTNSIDTGVPRFDDHIKSADFFDAEKYPNITFTSTSVAPVGNDQLRVVGDLTVHGVTKPAVLNVTINGVGPHPFKEGMFVAGFDAETELLRSEFGVGNYAPAVSDLITIRISAEAFYKTAE